MQFRVDKEKRTILLYDEETQQMRFLYMLDNNIDWNQASGIDKIYWENQDKLVELGGALSSGVKLSAPSLVVVGNKIAEENPEFEADRLKESIVEKIKDPKNINVNELFGAVDEVIGTNYTELYRSVVPEKTNKARCLVEENEENSTVLLYKTDGEAVILRRTDSERNQDFVTKFQGGQKDFFEELGKIGKDRIEFYDDNVMKLAQDLGSDLKQAKKDIQHLHGVIAYAIPRIIGVDDKIDNVNTGCHTSKWSIDIAAYAKSRGKEELDADEVIKEILGEVDFVFPTNFVELYEKVKSRANQVDVGEANVVDAVIENDDGGR